MIERQVPTRAGPSRGVAPATLYASGLLQRCGAHRCLSRGCAEEDQRGSLARSATRPGSRVIPRLVSEVLRTPGEPLTLGPRGVDSRHDFAHVRVHHDTRANASAAAVDAHAYTVGAHIVFASGEFAPRTARFDRLLAHELTHVVQQRASSRQWGTLAIAPDDGVLEHDACAAEAAGATRLQRDGFGELREAEGRAEELEARAKAAATGKPSPMEGALLTDAEHKTIAALVAKAGLPAASPLAHAWGSKFLLHDTSAALGPTKIAQEKALGRGPLGSGVSAYVPRDTAPVVTRPGLLETRRSSTTEYEKALDAFTQPGDEKVKPEERIKRWMDRRDALFRTAWNAATPAAQSRALDDALAGEGLTAAEMSGEKLGRAKTKTEPAQSGAIAQLAAGSHEKVMTTAAWAVGELVRRVDTEGAAAVAAAGREADLTAAAAGLRSYFGQRNTRVGSIIPVEIVQPGVRKGATNENTCDPKNPDIIPMSSPPYSENQYDSIALLYLRAADGSGRFPAITTHFVVDAAIGGHCDPRCFDLAKLYGKIATRIGHPTGSTYGPTPSYGTRWGTHNVWWDDTICGGAHP